MYNYFNFKKHGNDMLITNDLGHYSFLSNDQFRNLLLDSTKLDSDKFSELIDKKFITNGNKEIFINDTYHHVRNYKDYLFHGANLHIFVVTPSCNQSCIYCQASGSSIRKDSMKENVAKRSVEIALESREDFLTFEFQGGEPLINFDIIKYIVEYTERIKGDKIIEYNLVSNLMLLTQNMIDFFHKYNFNISTSIDGDEELHNINRPSCNGNSYRAMEKGVSLLKKSEINVSGIQTTTRYSLSRYKEIVDTYDILGLTDVFIRPLTKLGNAKKIWNRVGYDAEEFIKFYGKILDYIIDLNKSGKFIREGYTLILLNKILDQRGINYMELRSPCGAGIGQVAYFYDGGLYTCDEGRMMAEMGDNSFYMGSIFDIAINDVVNCPACKAVCSASCLEAIPYCSDCVYQPYCGVCPIISYSENSSLFSKGPMDFTCKIHMGILDILFEKIKDEEVLSIFNKWIN
ncbi:His-Xaa-Ser system radical SAM maturase HxsB [Tissierella sp.]|uniref:His-Xaa-Ser system radical SAM maturase HxsB n=1 Tax=Tissierella sp. TaxID=41274 RepID=UPI0028AD9DAC|nr:His-Xaa-Ser system radical SAM maturase HxsB [Tissierella sp.]